MKGVATAARWMVRITGPLLVVLGIGFWTGRWFSLVPTHRMLGVAFSLALLTLAAAALVAGAKRGLAALTAAWAILVPAFGMMQTRLAPGPAHWTVRLAHLLIGVAAMALADRLAKAVHARPDVRRETVAAGRTTT